MKKVFLIFTVLFTILLPNYIFAKEYNEFDIRFKEEIGTNVKNNEIKVYASVDEDETLVDRTSDFIMEDVRWYKFVSNIEDGKTLEDYDYTDEELNIYGYLVSDDDVFEDEYKYFLIISRLYAKEEDSFTRNVKINGIDVEELNGSCYNTGNEFYIKTIASSNVGNSNKDDIVTINEDESSMLIGNDNEIITCLFGTSFCCTLFLGLSICFWILVLIVLLFFVIIIIKIKKGRN